MKFVQLTVISGLLVGALGCGQKGPLVLPDAPKHKKVIPSLPGAPASQPTGTGTSSPAASAPATDSPSHP